MTTPSTQRLAAATGELTAAAMRLMEDGLPWYRALGARERSWVGVVAQAGIQGFLDWYEDPAGHPAAAVFAAAPRELARVISLEQTVALVRTTIGVVESAVDELTAEPDRQELREAILRYSREIAFSAAEVYARAAEARGAWDARLEALVVDALLRGEPGPSIAGRLGALGWDGTEAMVVLAGTADADAIDALRRAAEAAGLDLLIGLEDATLVALVGGAREPERAARLLSGHFGPGPVVSSTPVASLAELGPAARSVIAALRVAPAWPDAPRPVHADELLPERALTGDPEAAAGLVELVYAPLAADPSLLATASTLLEQAGTIEGTARALFVHPNTVRYRIRRIAEVTGCSPLDPREGFVLRVAISLGRLGTPIPRPDL